MSKFNNGDVVQLISGGPSMTAMYLESDETFCYWFKRGNLFQKKIKDSLLEISERDYGEIYKVVEVRMKRVEKILDKL